MMMMMMMMMMVMMVIMMAVIAVLIMNVWGRYEDTFMILDEGRKPYTVDNKSATFKWYIVRKWWLSASQSLPTHTYDLLTAMYERYPQTAKFVGPTWAHLGPVGPRLAPCWPYEPCYPGHHPCSWYSSALWDWLDPRYDVSATQEIICHKWPIRPMQD